MFNAKDLKGMRVTVLGLGVSGYAAAKFLSQKGAYVLAVDDSAKPLAETKVGPVAALAKLTNVRTALGAYDINDALNANLILTSPGIPLDHRLLLAAEKKGIPIRIEIELAAELSGNRTVGVTGTNGKSTVTAMIRHLLSESGIPAISCGNIGNPFLGELAALKPDTTVVLELSSFQLVRMASFSPHVGVLLNIAPDHIDWHGSFKAYEDAKIGLFRHQKAGDFAVINEEFRGSHIPKKIPSQIRYFSATDGENPNVSVCMEIANIFNISPAKAREAIATYRPLEHRMELVLKTSDYQIINDSKSTNVSSLAWALSRSAPPIVLIAGGRNKNAPFDTLRNQVGEKVGWLITMGETKEELLNAWNTVPYRKSVGSLKEALSAALEVVPKGGTVLFSPACKSFDMFNNYEERGRLFKDAARELVEVKTHV